MNLAKAHKLAMFFAESNCWDEGSGAVTTSLKRLALYHHNPDFLGRSWLSDPFSNLDYITPLGLVTSLLALVGVITPHTSRPYMLGRQPTPA